MNSEASKLLSTIERWSQTDIENRAAAVALSDDKTGNYYVHYAGPVNKIAKCVNALMENDLQTAAAIYAIATLFAHKNFPQSFIDDTNANCARIAELRAEGKTVDEIRESLTEYYESNN